MLQPFLHVREFLDMIRRWKNAIVGDICDSWYL